jgi:NTP pyrophosphatase (non-canonical NTP hydrolase)
MKDTYEIAILEVNGQVLIERARQNEKWGRQYHDNGGWLAILGEEFGEVCQAMQQGSFSSKETDADNLFEELIHVAAVASAFAEQVLRDKGK